MGRKLQGTDGVAEPPLLKRYQLRQIYILRRRREQFNNDKLGDVLRQLALNKDPGADDLAIVGNRGGGLSAPKLMRRLVCWKC